jgi:uncharacterized peroxidase-related enzyme
MSFIAVLEESVASGATTEMYTTERERVGYLPQYVQAFGDRPAVYGAWRQLISTVASSMPARRFELVTLAAAKQLRSTYCSVAHGAILAEQFLAAEDVIELARGGWVERLTDADRAVIAFAAKAAGGAADITSDDVDHLRSHGLDDAEILDVILAVAARCFFSTVLDATGTQADAVYGERLDAAMRDALTVGRPITTQPDL